METLVETVRAAVVLLALSNALLVVLIWVAMQNRPRRSVADEMMTNYGDIPAPLEVLTCRGPRTLGEHLPADLQPGRLGRGVLGIGA